MAWDPFSIFTGGNVADAAAQQRQYLLQQQLLNNQLIGGAQNQGIQFLQSGQYNAIPAISGGITTGRSDISGSVNPALAALYGGTAGATSALTGSVDPAIAALTNGTAGAAGAYSPLAALGSQYAGYVGGTSQAQADALGLNGPEGVARAQQSFQAGPGFQFALNTGIDALNRAAAAGGQGTLGGNVLRQAQTFGQGLGQQEWNNYLAQLNQRLGTFTSPAVSALSGAGSGVANALLTGGTGAANIYTGTGSRLADLLSRTGTGAAGIYTGTGQSLADLASRGGLAESGVYTGTANNLADLISGLTKTQTGFNQSLIGPYSTSLMAPALAENQGAQNFWNLLGSGAKLAAGGGYLPTGSYTPYKL